MTAAFNLSQFANKVNTSGQADLTTAVTGTLPVSNGGTGASTLTANSVLIGNGTSAVSGVAPSTSGNVLISNGTSWTSGTVAGLGSGQSWGNYGGSRSTGTTYTNSTGKPIAVSIAAYPRDVGCSIVVGGVTASTGNAGAGSYARQPLFAIVPNGVSYYYTGNSWDYWGELR